MGFNAFDLATIYDRLNQASDAEANAIIDAECDYAEAWAAQVPKTHAAAIEAVRGALLIVERNYVDDDALASALSAVITSAGDTRALIELTFALGFASREIQGADDGLSPMGLCHNAVNFFFEGRLLDGPTTLQ